MSVKIDPSGRRSIQVEVEVPGTPEQVWEAIATGSGISSWFVPTEMEGRVGGIMTCHFAPGMDSKPPLPRGIRHTALLLTARVSAPAVPP